MKLGSFLSAAMGAVLVSFSGLGCQSGKTEIADGTRVDSVSSVILEEALAALALADFSTAMGLAEGVEERQPGLVETQYVKGQIYYELHLYDEAEEFWSRVLEAEPEYWLWWQNMGDVAFRKEQFRRSAEFYSRAASLDSNPFAWHGLAGAYWEMGQVDSAAYALKRGLEADSLYAPLYLSRSNLAEERGDEEEAYSLARRAVRLDSMSAENRLSAGVLALKVGAFDEAVRMLGAALEFEPWNYTALYNMGQTLMRMGRREEALRYLARAEEARRVEATLKVRQDAIRSNPRNPANYVALADAMLRAGRIEDALRTYKTADLMVPADPHIRHAIAALYLEKGELENAVIRFQDIIHRDSTFVEAWLNLGVSYARMGEMEEARKIWTEARRRFPGNSGVAKVLAMSEGR